MIKLPGVCAWNVAWFNIFLSSGAKKRLRLLKLDNAEKIKKAKYDPNVVGLEESSTEQETESDEDDKDDEPEIIENVHDKQVIENSDNANTNKVENPSKECIDTKIKKKDTEVLKTVVNDDVQEKEVKKPLLEHPTICVEVKRDPKIQVARLKLPILGEEQRIMELVNENEFLIVAGETGKKDSNLNLKFNEISRPLRFYIKI